MKKILILFLTILVIFVFAFSGIGCGKKEPNNNNGNNPTIEIPVGKQYVSHFDKYEELCLWTFPYADKKYDDKTWWSSYHTAKVNVDENFIREGVGSMYLKTDYINSTSYDLYKVLKTHSDNSARGTLANSIYGAESITFEVYNCTSYSIKATMEVNTITTTVMKFSAKCEPNQWTVITAPVTENVTATIDNYRLSLKNLSGAHNFDVYIDNFYIQFPEK